MENKKKKKKNKHVELNYLREWKKFAGKYILGLKIPCE